MSKISVGDTFTSNQGYKIEVLEYRGCYEILVKLNGPEITYPTVGSGALRAGKVSSPYHPTVHNKGYKGEGKFVGTKYKKVFSTWSNIISRVGSSDPKYRAWSDCMLDQNWLNFQNFAEWYTNQPYWEENLQVDKDLSKSKIYSPDTCVLLPPYINKSLNLKKFNRDGLPIGVSIKRKKFAASLSYFGKKKHLGVYSTVEEAFIVYKNAKESYLKELAEKYNDLLSEKAYNLLVNYTVEVTD